MKKRCWNLLTFLILLLCVQVKAGAAVSSGSRAVGASLPVYREIVECRVDPDDFSRSLKEALAEAEEYATDERQYKIIIPPGCHRLDAADGMLEPYYIPSNVWIYGRGAVVDVTCGKMFMTRPGAEEPYRNIKIEGGTYRQSRDVEHVRSYMLLRLSHIRNMEIRDAKFLVKRRNHILELGNVNDLTISGCVFSGNDWGGNYPLPEYVQPKEAIQIDVATEEAIPNHPPYDGKGSHNVVIKNNLFLNVARGVGSHNRGAEKRSYTDITIENNEFRNLTAEAVYGRFWRNASIWNNIIVNGRHAGIQLIHCNGCQVDSNEIRRLKPFVGLRAEKYDSFGGIILNAETKNCAITDNLLSGSSAEVVFRETKKMSGNTITGNRKE